MIRFSPKNSDPLFSGIEEVTKHQSSATSESYLYHPYQL